MDDEKYIEVYSHFRKELSNITSGQPLPFDWLNLPKSVSGTLMPYFPYFQMLEDHATELANVINQLSLDIDKICAWTKIIGEYDEEDSFYIIHEFIAPLCNMCLNLPYAVRSRFIFSVTHLSHQANRTILGREWTDDLPRDEEIYFAIMDKYAAAWQSYKKLKLAMERLSDKEYQDAVNDYRDKYHHRYPSHIGVGLSQFLTRKTREGGAVSYALGYSKPLELNDIAKALKTQHERATKCFMRYQDLVKEQLERIYTQQQNRGDRE
jgi:hypothetical protein